MPIYEFVCSRCERRFEELILRSSDLTDVACSTCGCPEVERAFSVFGMAGSLEHPTTSGCSSCSSSSCTGCGCHSH